MNVSFVLYSQILFKIFEILKLVKECLQNETWLLIRGVQGCDFVNCLTRRVKPGGDGGVVLVGCVNRLYLIDLFVLIDVGIVAIVQ